jgi:hypothetical protein
MKISRTLVNAALISVETDAEYAQRVDENYYGPDGALARPCLALKFAAAADTARFMLQMAFILLDSLGETEGRTTAWRLANLSSYGWEGSWWVLYFPGVTLEG